MSELQQLGMAELDQEVRLHLAESACNSTLSRDAGSRQPLAAGRQQSSLLLGGACPAWACTTAILCIGLHFRNTTSTLLCIAVLLLVDCCAGAAAEAAASLLGGTLSQ